MVLPFRQRRTSPIPDQHKIYWPKPLIIALIGYTRRFDSKALKSVREQPGSCLGGDGMANQEHLAILKQGVEAWNQWRRERAPVQVDLSESALVKENLSGADLSGVDLSGVNLTEADLSGATLVGADLCRTVLVRADLSNADLSGANLSKALLIQTKLHNTTLTNCRVYGIAVWDIDVTEAEQSNLIITDYASHEPSITVDDLEVAQFIYLLLSHQKLRNVLNAVTAKGVLILGRFGGGGLEVLQAIAAKLRAMSYLPIIFDFERPHDHDYTETVKTLIGLVRFVIVDLSGPSVPQELSHTIPFFDIPFVPIIEKGRKSYTMFVDFFKYPWVLRPALEFVTVEELLARMPSEVIAPAEERHQDRQKLLDEVFKKA